MLFCFTKNENDEWIWTDGWPDIYSNWNVGEEPGTGGGCASFKDTGKWKDDDCNNNLTAICMISTGTTSIHTQLNNNSFLYLIWDALL